MPPPIHDATSGGFISTLRGLLESGTDPNMLDPPGQTTPLMVAAMHAQTECARLLLAYGAAPDMQDAEGQTALHYAAINCADASGVARLIMMMNPNTTLTNNFGQTALKIAEEMWNRPIADLLQMRQTPPEVFAGLDLCAAAAAGDVDMVRGMLAGGIDPNVRHPYTKRTALHEAASDDVAAFLIDAGVDIMAVGSQGETPAHVIAWGMNVDIMRRLLAAGIDINQVDNNGYMPLHYAAQSESEAMYELLRQYSDEGQRTDDGQTAAEIRDAMADRAMRLSMGEEEMEADDGEVEGEGADGAEDMEREEADDESWDGE